MGKVGVIRVGGSCDGIRNRRIWGGVTVTLNTPKILLNNIGNPIRSPSAKMA